MCFSNLVLLQMMDDNLKAPLTHDSALGELSRMRLRGSTLLTTTLSVTYHTLRYRKRRPLRQQS